jgi:hypothetical protein
MARFAGETATLHRRTDEKGLFTIGYKNDVAKFTPKICKTCKTSSTDTARPWSAFWPAGHRRRFSEADRRHILAEAAKPGASVSEVAIRADVVLGGDRISKSGD